MRFRIYRQQICGGFNEERPELNEIGVMLDQKIDGVADALRKT
jgi:hypothetical protein